MIVSLLFLLSLAGCSLAGLNKVLTDANFEHDTQAAGGQTTGIWLVRFCSPKAMSNWCVDGFIEYWAKLCDDLLEDNIMTGTVDLAKSPKLAKRFASPIVDASGLQFSLFKDGGMYITTGENDDDTDLSADEIKKWVVSGHLEFAKQDVPPEPTLMETLKEKAADPEVQRVAGIAGIALAVGVAGVVAKTVVAGKKGAKGKKA